MLLTYVFEISKYDKAIVVFDCNATTFKVNRSDFDFFSKIDYKIIDSPETNSIAFRKRIHGNG